MYSVGDGILKKIEVDEEGMTKKFSSVYSLFGKTIPSAKDINAACDKHGAGTCSCGRKH